MRYPNLGGVAHLWPYFSIKGRIQGFPGVRDTAVSSSGTNA